MHTIIEAWEPDGDVHTSDPETAPLSFARTLAEGVNSDVIGINVYLYDAKDECVARWHWRAT